MSASARHWHHIAGKGTYKPRTAHHSRFLLPWTRGGFYRRAPFRPDWFTPGNNGSISVSRRLILNMQDARAAFWRSRGIWLPEGVPLDTPTPKGGGFPLGGLL